jgi:hypothetical protein
MYKFEPVVFLSLKRKAAGRPCNDVAHHLMCRCCITILSPASRDAENANYMSNMYQQPPQDNSAILTSAQRRPKPMDE